MPHIKDYFQREIVPGIRAMYMNRYDEYMLASMYKFCYLIQIIQIKRIILQTTNNNRQSPTLRVIHKQKPYSLTFPINLESNAITLEDPLDPQSSLALEFGQGDTSAIFRFNNIISLVNRNYRYENLGTLIDQFQKMKAYGRNLVGFMQRIGWNWREVLAVTFIMLNGYIWQGSSAQASLKYFSFVIQDGLYLGKNYPHCLAYVQIRKDGYLQKNKVQQTFLNSISRRLSRPQRFLDLIYILQSIHMPAMPDSISHFQYYLQDIKIQEPYQDPDLQVCPIVSLTFRQNFNLTLDQRWLQQEIDNTYYKADFVVYVRTDFKKWQCYFMDYKGFFGQQFIDSSQWAGHFQRYLRLKCYQSEAKCINIRNLEAIVFDIKYLRQNALVKLNTKYQKDHNFQVYI